MYIYIKSYAKASNNRQYRSTEEERKATHQ